MGSRQKNHASTKIRPPKAFQNYMCQVALVQLCGLISNFGQQLANIHAILGILVGDDDSPPSRADQAPESEPVASDEPAFARTDQASATEPEHLRQSQ